MLTQAHRQEGLCRAYVQLIASRCGMSCSMPYPDYGADLALNEIERRGQGWSESGFKIDVQAKSTMRAEIGEAYVRYDMEVKTYEYLRAVQAWSPRILVLLMLPRDEREWCSQTEEQLVLRRCAYWHSLRGQAPTPRRKSVRILIPRENVFSVESLRTLVAIFKRGEQP